MDWLIFVIGIAGWMVLFALNIQAYKNTNPNSTPGEYIGKYLGVVIASFSLCILLLILLYAGQLVSLLSFLGINISVEGKYATAALVGFMTELILNLIRRKFVDDKSSTSGSIRHGCFVLFIIGMSYCFYSCSGYIPSQPNYYKFESEPGTYLKIEKDFNKCTLVVKNKTIFDDTWDMLLKSFVKFSKDVLEKLLEIIFRYVFPFMNSGGVGGQTSLMCPGLSRTG